MNFKDPKVIVGMVIVAYLIYHFFIKDEGEKPWTPPVVEGYTLVKTDDNKNGACGNDETPSKTALRGKINFGNIKVDEFKVKDAVEDCNKSAQCKGFTYKRNKQNRLLIGEYLIYNRDIKEPKKGVSGSFCYVRNTGD